MSKRDDIKKQLKQQADDNYGEATVSGSAPDPDSDDNTRENLEEVVGGNINPADEFHLADEVMKDEESRLPGNSYPEDVDEENEDDDSDPDEDMDLV